jgi:periplasmic mercuric ion binding protein
MTIKTCLFILSLWSTFLVTPIVHAEAVIAAFIHSETVTLDLQNMTCAMCQFTIKKALQKVEGVHQVDVDYASKTAQVIFDPEKTGYDALIKATTDAGYPAVLRPIAP